MDPITLITTLGPLAAQFFGGRKAAQTEADVAAQRKAAAEQQYEQLKADMPKYGVGSAWNQYLAMSKQDPAADMQRQIAAEQEASTVGALKAGGAKALLGGLGAAQRQAARQRMGIEAQSAARQQAALGQFAGVQQRAQDLQTRFGQQLGFTELGRAAGAAQEAQAVQDQMRQAKKLLGIEALSGLFGAAGDIAGAFKKSGKTGFDAGKAIQGMEIEIDPVQLGGGFNPVMSDDMLNMGTQVAGLPGIGSTSSYSNPFGPNASAVPFFREKGGMMTDGAFSHKTNPIDIMQDGAKVGEMTGGEAILNPEQQKKVSKESPYFRKLMREFAMKARK